MRYVRSNLQALLMEKIKNLRAIKTRKKSNVAKNKTNQCDRTVLGEHWERLRNPFGIKEQKTKTRTLTKPTAALRATTSKHFLTFVINGLLFQILLMKIPIPVGKSLGKMESIHLLYPPNQKI